MTSIRGADLAPEHFDWKVEGKVGTLTIDRPTGKTRSPSSPTPKSATPFGR